MAGIATGMSALSLSARVPPRLNGPKLTGLRSLQRPEERRALVIVAAQNADRRQRRIARETAYNRVFLDRIKSSSRAAIRGYRSFMIGSSTVSSEADLKPVDEQLNQAFSWIDKAVVKGVLHKSTAARRKAKITRVRKEVLITSGIYTPGQ